MSDTLKLNEIPYEAWLAVPPHQSPLAELVAEGTWELLKSLFGADDQD